MKLKEITPKAFQCSGVACPAVYEIVGMNKLVIVGSKINNLEKLGIAKRVGENEEAVIVDKEMLHQIFGK
ncbi:hypothetical protein CO010_00520 [Candidatus Shapirobacteria bacterium CG_4_8_14_3_um_filter_39_11]|uniref:Uncharacterized protein n=1 Tax=Candidatus Shapirobacteria bacterium CG_4_8_14_3_um_filter_39_11 TaxID=1974875 RepID=A0A2M8GI75_9BACT|nr:MAG: hypothetical protein CO010_00520 [Candidatus Shapirobacteria bacterium CG_4_8_14_3_um_filter_39_11]